ncbi:universal stress protein [Streptomyces cadmiisoli]|uniref:Universal stress protein n=1 Tax=Streptomyces cadmiisoli TaxID=2184053 RepID=A0A2Z4J7M1_9ACTN|nr:universal stress protein [Streptomyces cadmiisoli]AWW41134.1 universal stress protein [Streptomyces cadmiisoli]
MDTLPVVAAFDGSDDSLRALDWAVDAARRRAAPLRVVHVRQYATPTAPAGAKEAGPPEPDDPVPARARTHLAEQGDGTAVEYLAPEGTPSAVLSELSGGAELLVLGSRGRGGFARLVLGSTGLAVARDAGCPVVVVPRPGRTVADVPLQEPGPRVVVGLDVDGPDDAPLAFAVAEAARRGARLQVIAACPWPMQLWAGATGELLPTGVDQDVVEAETRALADGLVSAHRRRHPGVRIELSVAPGDAAGLLVANSVDADLLVVGRHRRRLLAPARMIGSVTHAVLLHAAGPVAVVPPSPPEE